MIKHLIFLWVSYVVNKILLDEKIIYKKKINESFYNNWQNKQSVNVPRPDMVSRRMQSKSLKLERKKKKKNYNKKNTNTTKIQHTDFQATDFLGVNFDSSEKSLGNLHCKLLYENFLPLEPHQKVIFNINREYKYFQQWKDMILTQFKKGQVGLTQVYCNKFFILFQWWWMHPIWDEFFTGTLTRQEIYHNCESNGCGTIWFRHQLFAGPTIHIKFVQVLENYGKLQLWSKIHWGSKPDHPLNNNVKYVNIC